MPESVKAVILVGGGSRGTRFRPLSLHTPKPLFPIAGIPMVQHHIQSLSQVEGMREILLIGFFDPQLFQPFINEINRELSQGKGQGQGQVVMVKYLREYESMGTGGGLFHFRDQILRGQPDAVLVLHADICSQFPLGPLMDFHRSKRESGNLVTVMGTRVGKEWAGRFGCIVADGEGQVLHYVEKPESFISDTISCGIYAMSPAIFAEMERVLREQREKSRPTSPVQQKQLGFESDNIGFAANPDFLRLEQDILRPLAGSGKMSVYVTDVYWRQIKSAASALPANQLYLQTPGNRGFSNIPTGVEIVGNVFIHQSAQAHPSAKIGPNVSIGPGVIVGKGVRIRDSIILDGVEIKPYACILHSIVGWGSKIGAWARIEGSAVPAGGENLTAQKICHSVPSATGGASGSVDNGEQSNVLDVTILGDNVFVAEGTVVRNCIVLPHKELKNARFSKQILM